MLSFQLDLSFLLLKLGNLSPNTQAAWGNMSAQRMVEHLSDALYMSCGHGEFQLAVPEEMIERMQDFLQSDKPMKQNIQVDFAPADAQLRNENLELAIDEFALAFVDFSEHFADNPGFTSLHPYYGVLGFEKWSQLHSKHFAHHFKQFGLID